MKCFRCQSKDINERCYCGNCGTYIHEEEIDNLKQENTRLRLEIDKLKDHIYSGYGGNS